MAPPRVKRFIFCWPSAARQVRRSRLRSELLTRRSVTQRAEPCSNLTLHRSMPGAACPLIASQPTKIENLH
jgi:hypothetical protein